MSVTEDGEKAITGDCGVSGEFRVTVPVKPLIGEIWVVKETVWPACVDSVVIGFRVKSGIAFPVTVT